MKTKLSDLYKQFIRRRSIKNTVMQEDADKLFLHNVMIKGDIEPEKLPELSSSIV